MGTGERDGVLVLVDAHLPSGATLGADRGYDVREFADQLRQQGLGPHIARNTTTGRRSASRDPHSSQQGLRHQLQVRKRIVQGFGWVKTIGACVSYR